MELRFAQFALYDNYVYGFGVTNICRAELKKFFSFAHVQWPITGTEKGISEDLKH
jgi:hypothetical protein